jgi:hypothetical protein
MFHYQSKNIPTVEIALESRTVEQLKKLAGLLPTSSKPTRKAELVAFVLKHLQGKSLRDLWQQLDPLQQAAVAEVVHSQEDDFPTAQFIAKYGQEPDWGTGERYYYNFQPSLLGLFFYDGWMPQDLKRQLKQFVPEPAAATLQGSEEMPKTLTRIWRRYSPKSNEFERVTDEIAVTISEMERAAPHDLQAVLRLIDLGKVTVSDKTLLPNSATLKAIAPLLEGGDYYDNFVRAQPKKNYDSEDFNQRSSRVKFFTLADIERDPDDVPEIGAIKPFAWVMLVLAGKLAELASKRLSLTKAGQKALNDPPAKTIRTLWQRWLKTTLLDELRRIESIKGQTGKGKRGLTAVSVRRSAISNALKDCPVGQWVAIEEFLRYTIAAGYDFEVSRQPQHLSLDNSYYGDLEEGDWTVLEARYILCLLFEYVATLGMIDVAYVHPADSIIGSSDLEANSFTFLSRYDGLAYFRLTPLGAYCLGIAESYTPMPMAVLPVLRVLPNLEIAAIASLSPADELLLSTYAQKISDSVWKLDQAQLLSAIESGRSIAGLQELLSARSSHPLPKTVLQFLTDIRDRAGSLQDLGSARLIKCASPALAALIANDSRTKKYCFLAGDDPTNTTAGSASYLVVPALSETKFRNGLRKLGYSVPAGN